MTQYDATSIANNNCRMGTHPSGPSTIDSTQYPELHQQPLSHFISNNPDQCLGPSASIFGNDDLPFLFKVLSIRTALSIQSHPDKSLAQKLHNKRPDIYKDGNHKPEMAIALSHFEALCGFCPHDELIHILTHVPELRDCCGESECTEYIESEEDSRKKALQKLFTRLMTADKELVREKIEALVHRLCNESGTTNTTNTTINNGAPSSHNIARDISSADVDMGEAAPSGTGCRQLSSKECLILRLQQQYPGDVGILASFFLNFLQLLPGLAVALPANEPHAYISGTIVECMATSDNVIRAGLTPKLRDTDVLCASLTYTQAMPSVLEGDPHPDVPEMRVYRPPFEEFEVWKLAPSGDAAVHSNGDDNTTKMFSLPAAQGPMIVLMQHGTATLKPKNGLLLGLNRGDVLFVSAGTACTLLDVGSDVVMWFAVPNGMWL